MAVLVTGFDVGSEFDGDLDLIEESAPAEFED